jgi:tetratricopeptide (TPR) repeat protein
MESFDMIEAYFDGEVSPEEASRFDQRIQEDPEFAEEVADYLGALAALRAANGEERKERFRELYRQGAGTERRGVARRMNSRRWVAFSAAAVVLGMLALAWLLYLRPGNAAQLADRYIRQNLASLPLKMGRLDSVQAGIDLYNQGKFAGALARFEAVLLADTLNPTALLNAGIVSLRMESYDKALDYFTKLEKHTDAHISPALFYEAVTLMRRGRPGDSDLAKQLLKRVVEGNLDKKKEAQELLGSW